MSTFPEFSVLLPQPEPQDVEVVTDLCNNLVSSNPIDSISDETASRFHADSVGLFSTINRSHADSVGLSSTTSRSHADSVGIFSITGRSHADSVGLSSTTSWQPEEQTHDKEMEIFTDDTQPPKASFSIDLEALSKWSEEKENAVKRPFDYIITLGGKAFRSQVLFALNLWLQADEESCKTIDEAVAMLHNSSLLIDDIQDESKQRRGSLSAHEVFGVAQTINSANYIYFQAQEKLRKLENWPQAFTVFNEELLNLHRGQGMELYWRDTLQPPSEADYLQMVANKTGGLFRLILKLLKCASKCEYDLGPFVDVLGMMFQILDDYKNLKDEKMSEEKGYCEDLTEGKFSFPICHAIWTNDPSKGEILGILKSKTTDNMLKSHVVDCLEKSGSLEYTRMAMETLYERARELLDGIPERNPAIEAVLDKLILGVRASK